MYTATIIILGIITIALVIHNWKTTNNKRLLAWLCICCPLSWIEFSSMNFADPIIEAWKFSPEHVSGIWFLGMAIEDFFFAPICGVMFFYIYKWIDRGINYTSSEFWKVVTLSSTSMVLLFFFCWGKWFGIYQSLRMAAGLFCIIYAWNQWDLKQFWVVMAGIFIIAGAWDGWANSFSTPQQWFYRDINSLKYSCVYASWNWWWFKIGKGWFPLSIFPYYYISGGVFTYGVIAALTKKFQKS